MKHKQVHLKNAGSLPKALLIGLGVGLAVCLLGVMVIAFLINAEKIDINAMGFGIVITLLTASFLSAAAALAIRKENVLVTSLLCAVGLMALLIICNIVIYGDGFDGVAVTGAVVFAGSVSAALLCLRPKKSRAYRGPKM